MIPIPNKYTQAMFGRPEFEGLDGELIVGKGTDKNLMQQTMSGVMSIEGEPSVRWCVFDNWKESGTFHERFYLTKHGGYDQHENGSITVVPHFVVNSFDDVLRMEETFVDRGYEGVMLRDPNGPYKEGRSTLKQGWLLKVKRFVDAEIEITGFVEQQRNDNEATIDERGYTKRSSSKAGKADAGVLGAILGTCISKNDRFYGVENIEVGTGFTAEQRKNLWEGRKYLIGKVLKYKYFPVGCKDKPRHPVSLGFRDRRDI